MTPAIVAASASDTLLTSFAKNSRDASATPKMANDPRCPRGTSLRYISRMSSFDARPVRTMARNCSSSLRRIDRARALCKVIPSNFGRNTFRMTCWVIVLPPASTVRRPVAYEKKAPAIPIGSMPGCW
jgi:hypothetical protein